MTDVCVYCKDCKWCHETKLEYYPASYCCTNPLIFDKVDLVTGQRYTDLSTNCYDQRKEDGKCGRPAHLFEPKEDKDELPEG